MWFKRDKKSEQDHALSESLRSLQSLLSETGRREPSLDPGDATPGNPGMAPPADRPSEPRPPRAANPGRGTQPQAAHRDDRNAEPGTPDSTVNRWRDLSLSFDAEPVLPRARRDTAVPEPDADTGEGAQTAAAGAGDGRHEDSVETMDPLPPDEARHDSATESPEAAESGLDTGDVTVDAWEPALAPVDLPETPDIDDGDTPAPETGPAVPGAEAHTEEPQVRADAPAILGENGDVAPDPGFRTRSDEEMLVLDLEEPALPPDRPESEPIDGPGQDEQAEDQLHLGLDGEDDAGIPVLTNAVYIPDTPAEPPASPAFTPPGPAGSPHDEAIDQCIDNLRVRFQLMGLEAFSPAQEKELHDVLAEFLDDYQRD